MNGTAAIDWGHASLVMPGETRSGDRFVIALTDSGALIAVIDGIGHGEEAAAAAQTARREAPHKANQQRSPKS